MSNPLIHQAIMSWVQGIQVDGQVNAAISSSLTVAADAASATAQGTFLGVDVSDSSARGQAIFEKPENLPTAVASILNHAQNIANFHPASAPPEQLSAQFAAYVKGVDAVPFFHLERNTVDKQAFYSKDYNLLIDQVVSLYKGVSSKELDEIKASIRSMATSVFGQERSERWKNLFSQSVIDFGNKGVPKFRLHYATFHMLHDKRGKAEVKQQDYEVHVTTYQVLPGLIHAYAEDLANLNRTSVGDWLKGASSPRAIHAKLCFAQEPYKARGQA